MNIARRYYDFRNTFGVYSLNQFSKDLKRSTSAVEGWCSPTKPTLPSRYVVESIEQLVKRFEAAETRRSGVKTRMPR